VSSFETSTPLVLPTSDSGDLSFALLPRTAVSGRRRGTAAARRVVSRGEVAVGTTGSSGDPALESPTPGGADNGVESPRVMNPSR
jgi:hypothetical protein